MAATGSDTAWHLTSLSVSHYNESARWALDRAGVPYTESRWLPLLQRVGVIAAHARSLGRYWKDAKEDDASSKFSTPVLARPDGSLILDSVDVLREMDAVLEERRRHRASVGSAAGELPIPTPLFPDPPGSRRAAVVEGWVALCHGLLGPHTRRIAYYHVLPDPKLYALATTNVGWLQGALARASTSVFQRTLVSALGLSPETTLLSLRVIHAVFDAVADALATEEPDLLDDGSPGDEVSETALPPSPLAVKAALGIDKRCEWQAPVPGARRYRGELDGGVGPWSDDGRWHGNRHRGDGRLFVQRRPFITGSTFTAADLSFSSMASIVLAINEDDGYGAYMAHLSDMRPGMSGIVRHLRAHPAGRHAVRMFQEQRGVRRLPAAGVPPPPPLRRPRARL